MPFNVFSQSLRAVVWLYTASIFILFKKKKNLVWKLLYQDVAGL